MMVPTAEPEVFPAEVTLSVTLKQAATREAAVPEGEWRATAKAERAAELVGMAVVPEAATEAAKEARQIRGLMQQMLTSISNLGGGDVVAGAITLDGSPA